MLIRRLPRASPSWVRISEWDTSVCFEVPAQPRGLPTGAGIKLAGGRDGPAQATGTMRHAGSPPFLCLLRAPGCGWLRPVLEAQERAQRVESRHGSERGTGRAPLEAAWVLPPPALRPGSWLGHSGRLRGICAFGRPGGPSDTYCVRGPVLGPSLCGARAPISDGRRQNPSRVRWR